MTMSGFYGKALPIPDQIFFVLRQIRRRKVSQFIICKTYYGVFPNKYHVFETNIVRQNF